MSEFSPPQTVLETAITCIRSGVSVIPVNHQTKRPFWRLLPKRDNGRAMWEPFLTTIADEETVNRWFDANGARSVAVVGGAVSGGLLILDFDVPDFGLYERWIEAVGAMADGLPVQRTGGGGHQVFLRCQNPGSNTHLAWVECESEDSGRKIAIETRGEGGYAVVPPSVHPTGNLYEMLQGNLGEIPTVSQALAESLMDAARRLDQCPHTRTERQRIERDARAAHHRRASSSRNGSTSVIETFNQAHAIEAVLESHGYSRSGDRFVRPGGTSPSVTVQAGRSCHFSSNDPLNDGRVRTGIGVHDSFDVYCILEHGGDVARAVRAAGDLLGIRAPGMVGPVVANTTENGGWTPDRLSQQANAEQLVHEIDGNARYNASRGSWMVYRTSEGRLVDDETGEVSRFAKKVARRTWDFVADPPAGFDNKSAYKHALDSEKSAGISAMMQLARTEAGVSIVATDLDKDGYLFNARNGLLDVRTNELRPHRRTDLVSKLAPVVFDGNALAPIWSRFLHRVMDGNDAKIDYLQRIAGLCLTGDVTVQELFIFWGGGANGKSVFIDTLTGMLGDYAGIAPDSLLTMRSHGAEHPTEIAGLCGKRLVAASETEEGAKLRVQLVKRLTGDATLTGRFMRCDFFEFPRTHKLILVTNNRPAIKETTNAVWRRVRLIPFTVTIPPEERDPNLLSKLKAEWPGILNWCIAGFIDFQAHGMQTPSDVTIATSEYQSEQDSLAEYLTERCVRGDREIVGRNEIFADYQSWAKAMGDGNPDRNTFYDSLRRVQGVEETMRRVSGRPTRVFVGLGLANLGTQYRQSQERLSETG